MFFLQINKKNNLADIRVSVFGKSRAMSRRLISVLLIIGMFSPTVIFGELGKLRAQNLQSFSMIQTSAPVSAPPEAFEVSSSKFRVPSWLSDNVATSFGMSLKTILGLFDTDAENNSSLITQPSSLLTLPTGSVRFDFDGDGKADLARWKSSATEWKVKNSSTGNLTATTIGSSSSIIAPGDFDGDGRTDAAVFNAGTWTIKKSSNNQTITVSFGASGDKPVVGDYDGDGLADCALFRPSTNTWWILQSSNANYISTAFGATGDITAQGNFDGDSKTDIAVFRPSTGDWYVLGSSAGYFSIHWGIAADIPVPADFDGDGKTDFAVYRGASGTWYVSKSSTNNAQYFTQVWGNYGDQPVPADYDGDGKEDFAVWRPTTGVWHIIKSSNANYDYQTLGQTGDTAILSAYLKQIGGAVAGYDLAKARLSPKNSTGGTDLYSRNFSWGTSLVGLSGRAGMGAGFGISYNSLVWTKEPESNAMYFDADNSNVSPGFRFGFPTIEPVYWDKDAERFNYLMVTPSGGRVEFRQIGVSDTYETADSSYTQLKTTGASNPNDSVENITITLSGTDGSKMNYQWKAGAFRCSEIKDRNGNFITINHDEQGLLRTVTDTLGRVISVNYNAELYPISITQTWKNNNGESGDYQYTWATFNYTTTNISTSFASGINIVGPANETVLKVLQKIIFPSGSHTTFEYNGYGQVKKVNNYAADAHLLNYTRTNLDNPAADQTDCPRFTETRNWVENFNLVNNAAQETVINNSLTENQTYNVGGISGSGTKIEVSMPNHPHGAISKTFVGGSGWREGLPIASEDWANGTGGTERKRWTWTNWTQDDPNLPNIQNPRVIESKVGDATNIKRSTIEYRTIPLTTIAEYGLVNAVYVYDTDQTTILKKVETDYNLGNAYVSRRIIGLVSEVRPYGRESSALNLVSKVTYNYDEGDFSDTNLAQNISTAIQHDNTNFSASLTTGRGNLTSTKRWNVEYPTNSSEAVSTSIKYNTAGAPVEQIDALGRTVKINYADNFNDTTTSRNTYAYPTKLYDPLNNYSEVKYRFDIGANVWAKSPAPAGNSTGKETARIYDSIGRLEKETLVNTGAYTRYEYPTNQINSKVYSTVIDTNNNGADANDEVFSESWTDGAGRVRKSRTEHPNSTGGWTGSLVEYDILGQVTRSTIPTEINSSYEPAGDDATRGWLWNSQEYDWMGRVVRSIPTDSNGSDGKDQLISYDGCGCAGGQVTTIQGELVPRDDNPNTNARRTQKIYEDILGRTKKTEIYNWDGLSVYTTTTQKYNGRDQVLQTTQYAGTESASNTNQTVSMSYDGHGRMKTRHYPIEDSDRETSWIYNIDDSIQQVIDPRGAITSFSYDSRGLMSQISYSVPNPNPSNMQTTPTVNFSYDALGNRTQMTDGTGTTDYNYNELSRLTSETKTFTGLSGSFTIGYEYNLAGGLKSYTDPFNSTVNYTNDKTGRLTSVAGTPWGDNTDGNYVGQIQYRAFGAVKQMNLKTADNNLVAIEYDNRLRVGSHQTSSSQSNAVNGFVQKAAFNYLSDSRPQAMDNQVNNHFDRTFRFDFAGRLTQNVFGGGQSGTAPYSQYISYDAFSQMTSRGMTHWGTSSGFSASFTNGRQASYSGSMYDAAGNLLSTHTRSGGEHQATIYDAANRSTTVTTRSQEFAGYWHKQTLVQSFDGDGQAVKSQETWQTGTQTPLTAPPRYQMWSSVLNSPLTKISDTGTKLTTKVFAGGAVIAEQNVETGNRVEWISADPVTGSSVRILKNGAFYDDDRKELEPLGQEVLPVEPPAQQPSPSPENAKFSASEPEWQCQAAGAMGKDFFAQPVHCQKAQMESGSIWLSGLFSSKTEYNVQFIQFTDSPLPDSYSGDDEMMTYTLSATSKQQDDKPKPKKKKKSKTKIKPEQEKPIAVVQSLPDVPSPFDPENDNLGDFFGKMFLVMNFVDKRVKFIGLSREQEGQTKLRLFWMLFWKPCSDAFKADGLPTLGERIKEFPLIIAHADLLKETKNNTKLGLLESARLDLQGELYNEDAPAIATDKPYRGKNYIFLKEKAFSGEIDVFDVVFPHETMHTAGASHNNYAYFLGIFRYGTDLSGRKNYEEVIKNCRIPQEKK